MRVKVRASESFTITVPGDSSVYLGLTREEAVDLLNQLRSVLGDYVGMHISRGAEEPEVPIGTKLVDNVGDTLEKVDDGWRWAVIDGEHQYGNSVYRWETVGDEHSFVVIS